MSVKKTINNLSVENSKMANTCVHPAGHFCCFCYAAPRWVFLLFTCVRSCLSLLAVTAVGMGPSLFFSNSNKLELLILELERVEFSPSNSNRTELSSFSKKYGWFFFLFEP